jgi:hypothetical protein
MKNHFTEQHRLFLLKGLWRDASDKLRATGYLLLHLLEFNGAIKEHFADVIYALC